MKAFQEVLEREHADDTKLGMPSNDYGHHLRRMAAMERMTGGRGFSKPRKEQRANTDGTTRGQRRRERRAIAMARVSEERAPKFMHSSARRRAQPELYPEPRPMTGFLATMRKAA